MSQYKVGYKRPPLHTRFVKGMSGNPKGRPKQSAQKSIDLFLEEMGRKLVVNEGNKKSKITVEQAIFRQLAHKAAVKGEMPAIKHVFQMLFSVEQLEELTTIPTPILIINPPSGPQPPMPPIHGVDCDCHGCYDPV